MNDDFEVYSEETETANAYYAGCQCGANRDCTGSGSGGCQCGANRDCSGGGA